jgi:hypothetical protein
MHTSAAVFWVSIYQQNYTGRIFQQRRKVLHDGDGNAIEYDESDDELSKLRQRHITTMEIAFRMRLAEDLEWALLVRQRLVFLEDTDEGKEGAHRTNEEFPVEPATSVAKYYSCPSYVLLDPECVFDYSNFTSLAADEPIYHRPGPDGRTRHFQGRLQLRIETGDAGWIHAEVIEAEFQEYLRNQVYRQEDIIREGHCEGHPGECRKGVSLQHSQKMLQSPLRRCSIEACTNSNIEFHLL